MEANYEAYCLRCKKKRIMKNTEKITMKTGMKSMKGECPECECKMFKILPKNKNNVS